MNLFEIGRVKSQIHSVADTLAQDRIDESEADKLLGMLSDKLVKALGEEKGTEIFNAALANGDASVRAALESRDEGGSVSLEQQSAIKMELLRWVYGRQGN